VCSSDTEKRIDMLTFDALPYFNSIFKKLLQGNCQKCNDPLRIHNR
jgi:hypothetical protein